MPGKYQKSLRDACKKSIAHFLSFQDRGSGEGRQNQNCLLKPENELLFYDTSESKKITGKRRSKLPTNILLEAKL